MLGLRTGAAWDAIDAAHRRLAARAHPDRWLSATAEDQEAARARFEEVNAAHRTLRSIRGVTAPAATSAPRRRERPAESPPPPPPPPPRPEPPPAAVRPDSVPPDAEPAGPGISKALLVAVGVVGAVVAVLAVVGAMSTSPDGGRQRRVLGPLAHAYWEAERTGDYGAMWDVLDDDVHAAVDRAGFVAHLERCPPRPAPAPRSVVRMTPVGGGRWEVGWEDAAGQPGIGYFRQVGAYAFRAEPDPVLLDFLRVPVAAAPDQAWCNR